MHPAHHTPNSFAKRLRSMSRNNGHDNKHTAIIGMGAYLDATHLATNNYFLP